MATIYIYVSRNGNSSNIKLRDSDGKNPGNDDLTSDVNPGDTIIWKLDSNSNLYSLDGIQIKPDSPDNLLTSPPTGSNNEFSATVVSISPGKGKIEKYMVGYTVSQGDETIWDDPKLRMDT